MENVNQKRKAFFALLIAALLIANTCAPMFTCADSDWEEKYEEKIGKYFNLAKAVMLPLAAVGVASGAYKMLFGSEKDGSAGLKQIIYCCLAIAAILLLPAAIKAGLKIGRTHGWMPGGGG